MGNFGEHMSGNRSGNIADLDACNAQRIPSNVEGLSLLIGYVGALRLTS